MANFIDDFIQVFIGSTILTLKIQGRLEVTHSGTFIKGERQQRLFEVGGMLGITGTLVKGSIALCFPKNVFIPILKNLLNEPVEDITTENEDAAAELLNIIFSHVKSGLKKRGHEIQTALPYVIHGTEMEASYAKSKKVHVIAFQVGNEEFYAEILSDPLEEKEKVEASQQKPAPASIPIPVKIEFLKQFAFGAINSLKIQCSLNVKPGTPTKSSATPTPFDLAGVVGITSNTVNGSFSILFKNDVFLKLASKLFNEEITEFQPGMEDLVAELTNMALGSAKKVLNPQGHGIQMAIPTVLRGTDMRKNRKGRDLIVIPLLSEIGEFHVEIEFAT